MVTDGSVRTDGAEPPPSPSSPEPPRSVSIEVKHQEVTKLATEMVARHELAKPVALRRPLTGAQARIAHKNAVADLTTALTELQVAWNAIFSLKAELEKAARLLHAMQSGQETPASAMTRVQIATAADLNSLLRVRR